MNLLDPKPMTLDVALRYASKIVEWLSPFCERIEVAGSIRRQRPMCGDVDIVCIPKVIEERDMLGEVIDRRNLVHHNLHLHVMAGRAQFRSGGEREGQQCIVQLSKCQLDVWFASPQTWATRLLCRTGSMQHNIWLAEQAKDQGKKWSPYAGILAGGRWLNDVYGGGSVLQALAESDIYRQLGLDFIPPANREK